jgi:hypothetical protein
VANPQAGRWVGEHQQDTADFLVSLLDQEIDRVALPKDIPGFLLDQVERPESMDAEVVGQMNTVQE